VTSIAVCEPYDNYSVKCINIC